jgi:response regulator RpfG family c-di-GMP phosphodiesterase
MVEVEWRVWLLQTWRASSRGQVLSGNRVGTEDALELAMSNQVLLVDHDPQTLACLTRLLRGQGYEVQTAATGEEALERLQTFRAQLVISGFKLAGMNGAQLLNAISKAVPLARRVLLSGALETGGTEATVTCLRKPWDKSELLAVCSAEAA